MQKPMKKNKYPQQIEAELDLHGLTKEESKNKTLTFLVSCKKNKFKTVQIITGKGIHSKNGSILKPFIENLLKKEGYFFETAKINEGGSGAIKIKLNY